MQNIQLSLSNFISKKLKRNKSVYFFNEMNYILKSLALICIVLFISCTESGQKDNKASGARKSMGPILVEMNVITPKLLINSVSASGTILASEKAELRPEISGRIISINFNEGEIVRKDKLLVKINDSDLQAQLKRNEAQGMLLANDELQKRKLLEIKAISNDEYDLAKSQLLVNQADKQLLKAQIAKTEIYAPFNGKIGLRSISPGNFITSNTLIATIQQVDPIKIEFDVPEKYNIYIKPGLEISFGVDGSDSIFSAKIYAIESSITTETRTLKVRAISSNSKNLLKPGSFARINIILERINDAFVVPSEAVLAALSENMVYICKNGKAVLTKVNTGIRTENEIQITNGIQAGDSLITTGLLQLTNGALVSVKGVSK